MRNCLLPVLLSLSLPTFAYNPPSDTAGPLTVEMQPPAFGAYGAGGYVELSQPGVPFMIPVHLRNASDQAIAGTLRMVVAPFKEKATTVQSAIVNLNPQSAIDQIRNPQSPIASFRIAP